MNTLPIYLGYKYFRSKKGAFASFTSLMAIAGLSLGVAALVIVLSVMNGFEKELQTRVLGVVPQLVIRSDNNIDNYISYTPFLDSLAKHSLVFSNAFATSRKSIHAMPSIIAGVPSFEVAYTDRYFGNTLSFSGIFAYLCGVAANFCAASGHARFFKTNGCPRDYGRRKFLCASPSICCACLGNTAYLVFVESYDVRPLDLCLGRFSRKCTADWNQRA